MKSADRRSSGTPHKSPATTKAFLPGTEIDNRWIILQGIGKGAFSEILAAKDTQPSEDRKDKPFVAVKIQTACLERSVLKWEAAVVKDLSGHPYFPKFFAFHESTSAEDPEYIVMEYLCGEDMATIRNRARSRSETGLVPLCIASYLVRDMLRGLREMHARGYVHRDVKPSNFVRRDDKTTKFCVIDFGLTKSYKDSSGILRPEKQHADFRGTTVYASPFVHEGHDQCPRDDLISVLHVFFDMIVGKLPWGDAARSKDKVTAATIKRHMYSNPFDFINWLCEEVSSKSAEGYEQNFSVHTQNIALEVIKYLASLQYADVPNYDWLDARLFDMVPKNQYQNVGDINFSYEGFNWHDTSSRSATFMAAAMSTIDGSNNSNDSTPFAQQTSTNQGRTSLTTKQFLENPGLLFITDEAQRPAMIAAMRKSATFSVSGNHTDVDSVPSANNQLQIDNDNTLSIFTTTTMQQPVTDPNIAKMKNYANSLEKLLLESTANLLNTSSKQVPTQSLSVEARKEVFKMALRWSNVMKLVYQIPVKLITLDVLDIALRIARRHHHFFGAYIEDDMPDRWEEFCQWQEMIGKTYDLYQQVSVTLLNSTKEGEELDVSENVAQSRKRGISEFSVENLGTRDDINHDSKRLKS